MDTAKRRLNSIGSVTARIGLYLDDRIRSIYVFPGNPLTKSVGSFRICRKYKDRYDSKADPILAATDLPLPILGGMLRTLRLASALATSWQCQRCDCINNSAKNKRRCFSCRAWRDGIAPLSAAGIAIADARGGGGTSFCSNENDAPALSI